MKILHRFHVAVGESLYFVGKALEPFKSVSCCRGWWRPSAADNHQRPQRNFWGVCIPHQQPRWSQPPRWMSLISAIYTTRCRYWKVNSCLQSVKQSQCDLCRIQRLHSLLPVLLLHLHFNIWHNEIQNWDTRDGRDNVSEANLVFDSPASRDPRECGGQPSLKTWSAQKSATHSPF